MSTSKTHYEKTSAASTSIGFDFQYYYFLLSLLKLRSGEEIGLEIKDDIHINKQNGELILLQLKHSIQANSEDKIINLTERDIDLWKTLYNWIQVITDSSDNRGNETSQLNFLNKTSFILASNKNQNASNLFFDMLEQLKNGKISIKDFKDYLKTLLDNTVDSIENSNLRQYISELKNLKQKVLLSFLKKVEFRLNEDDLIKRIKNELKHFMIPPEKIDDVYNSLNSNVRDKYYIDTKKKKKFLITYDQFYNEFRICFGKVDHLPIRRSEPLLPDNLENQNFIRQLIDIGDVKSTDQDVIIQFTKLKLLMFNNLKTWIQKGELTESQKRTFMNNCILQWQTSYRSFHRHNNKAIEQGKRLSEIEDGIKEAGLNCLDEIRKIPLSIENQLLDMEISNGQFYLLSDDLLIGWHLDWERKYIV